MLRLEKMKLGYGRQQTLSVAAIDFVSKQVALKRIFLNSVLALATDQQAVIGIVLEHITGNESNTRHDDG